MTKNRTKLISAALMLVLSVVMLAGASMAWFTVSTAPEISGIQVNLYTKLDLLVSDSADGEFTQSVSTKDIAAPQGDNSIHDLPFYAHLKPISTVDGINWYRPKYYDNGYLEPVENFLHSTAESHGNVLLWTKDSDGNYHQLDPDSIEYFDTNNRGYFVYADIWLKTELEEGVAVTLSVPNVVDGNYDNAHMESWEHGTGAYGEKHGNKYGSYALGTYDANGCIDNNAQAALRVGFLVDGKFFIWEPNADQRSEHLYKPKEEEADKEPQYIHGYGLKTNLSNYQSGYYIPTRPVGKGEDGKPQLVDIPTDRLLVQMQSYWDEKDIQDHYLNPSSADVLTFGKFVANTQDIYDRVDETTGMASMLPEDLNFEVALASNNIITRLVKDTPKKVRIFFWLEGQDVDCWNDIASGSFLVNLEFAAQPGMDGGSTETTAPNGNG